MDKEEDSYSQLRKMAEKNLKEKLPSLKKPPVEHAEQLIHDLQVHQIELEMQNHELKRAQSDLTSSRERYFNLFHQAPVGYATIDKKGFVRQANQALTDMLGVSPIKIRKKPLSRYIHPEDLSIFANRFNMVLRNKKIDSFDIRMNEPSGKVIHTKMAIRPAVTPAGRQDQSKEILVVLLDITGRKEAEKALHEKEKLEGILELAGAVCHELRQPLQAIMGISDLISFKIPGNEDLEKEFSRLKNEVDRLNVSLHQLENITRYETKPYIRDSKILDLNNSFERRQNRRYSPIESMFVDFDGMETMKMQLIDISKGGFSFHGIGHLSLYLEPMSHFSCGFFKASSDIMMKHLPCLLIPDATFSSPDAARHIESDRRHRAKFINLSHDQVRQLETFLHTLCTADDSQP